MKTLSIFLILSVLLLPSCQPVEDTVMPMTTTNPKDPVAMTPGMTTDTTQRLLLAGKFVSNVHPTSGTITLNEKEGKRTLEFVDFKTDPGPDLRIYLAENTALRNFIDIGKLDGRSGRFSIELPAEADPTKQRFVLIWCKPFSVLFGNAELK
jgi:hypothetical protein